RVMEERAQQGYAEKQLPPKTDSSCNETVVKGVQLGPCTVPSQVRARCRNSYALGFMISNATAVTHRVRIIRSGLINLSFVLTCVFLVAGPFPTAFVFSPSDNRKILVLGFLVPFLPPARAEQSKPPPGPPPRPSPPLRSPPLPLPSPRLASWSPAL